MARPQSPELRRSGTTPAFEPDSIASRLEAHERLTSSGESGPVPEQSSPGHRPDHDQDKPDPDAFAARFSGADLDQLPSDTGVVDDGAARVQRWMTGCPQPVRRHVGRPRSQGWSCSSLWSCSGGDAVDPEHEAPNARL